MTTTEALGHDQLLEYANAFMKKTGIRTFCQKHCQGTCCRSLSRECHTPKTVCRKNRRLGCALWLCGSLQSLIYHRIKQQPDHQSLKEFFMDYVELRKSVIYAMGDITEKIIKDDPHCVACFTDNLPPGTFDELKIEAIDVPELDPKMTSAIRKIIKDLRKKIEAKPDLLDIIKMEREISIIVLERFDK